MDDSACPGGFHLVVAATAEKRGIGAKGGLPAWKLPGDMAYFKELTSRTCKDGIQNAVIMGRKTWESIPAKRRPLPGRLNVVLSRGFGGGDRDDDAENSSAAANGGSGPRTAAAPQQALGPGVLAADSFAAALELVRGRVERVFVIGGGQVYAEALQHPACAAVHLTRVEQEFDDCDTYMPPLDSAKFRVWSASQPVTENGTRCGHLVVGVLAWGVVWAAGAPPPRCPLPSGACTESCCAKGDAQRCRRQQGAAGGGEVGGQGVGGCRASSLSVVGVGGAALDLMGATPKACLGN